MRSVLVVDGDGMLVASFPEWATAHEWAHARAVQAAGQSGAPLPIRVEDFGHERRTLEVFPDRCDLTFWLPMGRAQECSRPQSEGVTGFGERSQPQR